jgi:flagellar hook assembly protein FlgD
MASKSLMRRCRSLLSQAMIQRLQAAALVGHQVMVAGSGMQLTDAGAVGGVELAANADQVKSPSRMPMAW